MAYVPPTMSGTKGLTTPLALQSDYFKDNRWNDPTGGMGNQFLQRRLGSDPLAAGGDLGNMSRFNSRFGFQQYDPNDPRIGQGMANLVGGTRNMIDDYASRMANAGVAGGRSAMGVRGMGGGSLPSQLALQGTKDIAGDYANRYGKAVDWTMQGINQANSAANAYAGLYGDIYRADLSTGANLLGMGADDRYRWMQAELGARNQDVGNINNRWQNERQWNLDRISGDREWDQQQQAMAQRQNLNQLLQQSTIQHQGGTPLNSGTVEYLRQMGMLPTIAGSGGKSNTWNQGIRGF